MADFVPKPSPGTFKRMSAHHGLAPQATAFFEDSARNLKPAHDLGMTTVLVAPKALETEHAFVHHRTDDLTGFLSSALTKETT
jgi:putative hydrolase of the HAD superfamily